MKHFHLRLIPINRKMKNKTMTKHPKNSNKFHKKKRNTSSVGNSLNHSVPAMVEGKMPTPVLTSSSSSLTNLYSGSTAVAECMVQPASKMPKPTSERTKKVKIEEGLRNEKDSRFVANQIATGSQAVPSAGGIIRSIFTEGDEIIILQSMIEYARSKNLPLPLTNLKEFYTFLKGKLSTDFTNSQLYDKIRRLKARYLKRLEKKCGVPGFSSNHDFEVYTISKNIWVDVKRVDDDDGEDDMDCEGDKDVFYAKYPLLMESLDWENSSSFSKLDTVKENMHMIGSEKATELEMQWMELQSKESEIRSKKMSLKMELIRLVLDATKGGEEPSPAAAGAM